MEPNGQPRPASELLRANVDQTRALHESLAALADPLDRATDLVLHALREGGKVLACGNGGSACDASHFVGEIVGRYVIERRGYPAVDLTTNSSLTTALINDYPPEQLFARQVDALGRPGDVLVVFSTSGRSVNVREALVRGRAGGLSTVAFLGRDGGHCSGLAAIELLVPAWTTARIQEAHLLLYHTLCESIDPLLAGASSDAAREQDRAAGGRSA